MLPQDPIPPPLHMSSPQARIASDATVEKAERPSLDASLRLENILMKEFDYAGLSAYQVYDNRERIFNFYFTIMGALLSGLGALYQISVNTATDWRPLAAALLGAGGLLSIIFYVRLIHLRQSLRDSIITTYVIKEFYIQQFIKDMPKIEHAFRWRLATIPSGERPSSDTSFVLYPVAILGALSFGAAALIGDQMLGKGAGLVIPALQIALAPWLVGLVTAGVVALLETWFHRSQLSADKELKILENQAMKLGITLGEANQRHSSATLLEQLMKWRQGEGGGGELG